MVYSGWSYRKRPFSIAQFRKSHLGKTMTYTKYLTAYARQYKNPRLRKSL